MKRHEISQTDLQEHNKECAAEFLRLFDQSRPDIGQVWWVFWTSWDACDRKAGHFSQDEIDWLTDIATPVAAKENDTYSLLLILKEMRKSRRG